MNRRPNAFLLLLFILLGLSSCTEEPLYKQGRILQQLGDDLQWAARDWDDQYWNERVWWVADGGIYWSRIDFDILKAPEALRPYGLQLFNYGEYEVYWDGVLIGKNGNPGREEELGPEGQMWATFSIPTELTEEGAHQLAIRSSLYYYPNHTWFEDIKLDYYDNLLTDTLVESSYMHVFAGAFLIASFYFFFLFLSNKKEYGTLIFSISCFLLFLLILMEFMKAYVPIHYSQHVARLQVIGFLMFGISFLIPFYFSMVFPIPGRKFLLAVYAGVLLFVYASKHDFFELTADNMALSMWIFSIGIVVYGAYKKMKGAWMVLLTLLLAVPLSMVLSFDKSLFAGFSLILLGMFYLLTMRLKEQRLAYEDSLVQSTRLRLELLKKNIQPHFLMNTLTSLMDWVEEAPQKGVLFIEALAKEFDQFNEIEDQKLIPIGQEIALCRTHMEIMEYRKEVKYTWKAEGIDPEQMVPPAIIHTLLENGITHSLPLEDNSVHFTLSYETDSECHHYTFLTLAKGARRGGSHEEGTGLKYIKARLTESYQGNWDFESGPVAHGWKTVIKIYS